MAGRAKFITLEGGEGAGKSTQARLLKQRLEDRGHRVRLTREPGGSPGAEEIRRLLVEGEPDRWTPLSETLLFLAARADHIDRIIRPVLDAGEWVICDRFSDSTFVYQGVARGLGIEKVRAMQKQALGAFEPDLTLLIDLDPAAGLARAKARDVTASRFERFDLDFHAKLRAAFRALAAEEPQRCAMVDGGQTPEQVSRAIWQVTEQRLSP